MTGRQKFSKIFASSLAWPLMAFIGLLAYNALVNPEFFTVVIKNGQLFGSLVDIFFRASPLILTALGMTLVIATGGVDLSVGTVSALAGAFAALSFAHGATWPLAITVGLGAGIIVGLFNAILINVFSLQPIVSSLIAMVAGRGFAQLCVNGQIAPLENANFVWIGTGTLFGLPFAIPLSLILWLVLSLLLRRTALGLFIEALGANSEAGRYVGLSVLKVRGAVYLISGLMASVAGLLMAANIRAVDVNNLGLYLELDAILAVVIGGTNLKGGRFSLLGSVLGAVIIQTVTTTINTQGVAVQLMLTVKAAVVIVICLAQSEKFREQSGKILAYAKIFGGRA